MQENNEKFAKIDEEQVKLRALGSFAKTLQHANGPQNAPKMAQKVQKCCLPTMQTARYTQIYLHLRGILKMMKKDLLQDYDYNLAQGEDAYSNANCLNQGCKNAQKA